MREGLACTVFCCSVDRWMYEVENVARRGVRRERARVRARETRVSVHCGVARVPVRCERPDRVSIRHGDRVSCVRCATGRTARSTGSCVQLVSGICAAAGRVGGVVRGLRRSNGCVGEYGFMHITVRGPDFRGQRGRISRAGLEHRASARPSLSVPEPILETRNAKGLVTVNPPIHSDTPCSLVVWFFSPRLRLNARARQLSWTPYSRTDTVP